MKTWDQPPKKAEVEEQVRHFFQLLRRGDLDGAQAAVAHASDDWDSQIWSLWQDTYLLYLEDQGEDVVDDDSFEGKAWLKDLSWLKALGLENKFNWDEDADVVEAAGEHVFVNLTYAGEVVDVSADFNVTVDSGTYKLVRDVIHIA